MLISTQQKIIQVTTLQFAIKGYEGIRMRPLAALAGVAPSVLYHYFANKDDLLKAVYQSANQELGKKRASLSNRKSFEDILKSRVLFQFQHAESIVAVLKYYLHFRLDFKKNDRGYLPKKTYLHIEEVLQIGESQGKYSFPHLGTEAKVIVHAINGFILEYFPTTIASTERTLLVNSITNFILNSLETYRIRKS